MRAGAGAAAVIAAVILTTSCADNDDEGRSVLPALDFGAVGECSRVDIAEPLPLATALRYADSWAEVKDLRVRERSDVDADVTFSVISNIRGSVGEETKSLGRIVADRIPSEVHRAFVSSTGPYAGDVVLIDDKEDVFFVGPCLNARDEGVRALASMTGEAPAKVLRRLLADPVGSDMKELEALTTPKQADTPKFADLPPEQRQVDPADGSVPPTLLAHLKGVQLTFEVPTDWRRLGDKTTLCGKIDEGLTQCTSLLAGQDVALTLDALARPGERLEVWIGQKASFGAFLGPVAVIPSAVADSKYVLRPLDGIGSFADVLANAAEGRVSFVLA